MSTYDYKTVAAPRKVRKIRGVKGKDAQMAYMIEELIQEEAAAGWDYQRADTFPIEESGGFFSKSRMVQRAVLVFRRPRGAAVQHAAAAMAPVEAPISTPFSPAPAQPAPEPRVTPEPRIAAEPEPARPVPNEPSFSIAGVAPPKAPPIGGARDD